MKKAGGSTLPVTLEDLVKIQPLASASIVELTEPEQTVEQVTLAETLERLRRSRPRSLIVLHAEAATGGWSLAAAVHLAWERRASAVVVSRSVAGPSSAALARRLQMPLFLIDVDPVDLALQLAGHVSAPNAARALRQARLAEHLAEQNSIRGILGVLNTELPVPVALVVGDAVVAGRAAGITGGADQRQVSVDLKGPGERPWARLVAGVPARLPAVAQQVEGLLHLARPSLVAAWAQTQLNSSLRGMQEEAAYGLLRRLAADPASALPDSVDGGVEVPRWTSEFGWRVEAFNRAVWLAPVHPTGETPEELTHLLRAAWQRGRRTWPLVREGDGWISWYSSSEPEDRAALRTALTAFRETAAMHELSIGVGRAHAGVTGLMRSVAEARLAAHVARGLGPATMQWFDEVGAPAVLAWLPTREIVQVADLCLADLVAAKDRAALVDTVLAVLDCGGSLNQASQRLGVHRNTVLSRVARARQLGLAFDDPRQRLALHVLCYSLASLGDSAPTAEGVSPLPAARGAGPQPATRPDEPSVQAHSSPIP